MKKLFSLSLLCAVVFAMTACGSDNDRNNSRPPKERRGMGRKCNRCPRCLTQLDGTQSSEATAVKVSN